MHSLSINVTGINSRLESTKLYPTTDAMFTYFCSCNEGLRIKDETIMLWRKSLIVLVIWKKIWLLYWYLTCSFSGTVSRQESLGWNYMCPWLYEILDTNTHVLGGLLIIFLPKLGGLTILNLMVDQNFWKNSRLMKTKWNLWLLCQKAIVS